MPALQELKNEIHQLCLLQIEQRINALRQDIEELRQSAGEQGKSSAGDKHETGRAMTDLEVEKNLVSLKNILQSQSVLKQVDTSKKCEKPVIGALVVTDQGLFYIVAALGKIKVSESEVLVISPDAPLVKALQSYPSKNPITFNGRTYRIAQIA